MKGVHKALLLTALTAAFLIPVASSNPDGLQRVAIILGAQAPAPLWAGLISQSSTASQISAYAGRVLAAVVGMLLVFGIAWLVGSVLLRRRSEPGSSRS